MLWTLAKVVPVNQRLAGFLHQVCLPDRFHPCVSWCLQKLQGVCGRPLQLSNCGGGCWCGKCALDPYGKEERAFFRAVVGLDSQQPGHHQVEWQECGDLSDECGGGSWSGLAWSQPMFVQVRGGHKDHWRIWLEAWHESWFWDWEEADWEWASSNKGSFKKGQEQSQQSYEGCSQEAVEAVENPEHFLQKMWGKETNLDIVLAALVLIWFTVW